MKDLNNILKGFDLADTHSDGTKQYSVKQMHHVIFDYFEVQYLTVFPNGDIDLAVGINCDSLDGVQNQLDEFHVYELTEIA